MSNPNMTPVGLFHQNDVTDTRRRIISGYYGVTNGTDTNFVINQGGYARMFVETFMQAQHGSNGYMYRLDGISRYGHNAIHVDQSFNGSVAFTSSIGGNADHNGLTITPSSNATYNFHMNVYYFNTETGTEVGYPSALTLIGVGV